MLDSCTSFLKDKSSGGSGFDKLPSLNDANDLNECLLIGNLEMSFGLLDLGVVVDSLLKDG